MLVHVSVKWLQGWGNLDGALNGVVVGELGLLCNVRG